MIPVLFLVSVVVFAIGRMAGGSAAAALLGENAAADEIALLRTRLGEGRPAVPAYIDWISGIFHGDFGVSTANGEPVSRLFAERAWPTITLALCAFAAALAISLALAFAAAAPDGRRFGGRAVRRLIDILSLAGVSVPGFLLGLFLMMIFAVRLRWFPVRGGMVLPALSLGIMYAAIMTRLTRAMLLETKEKPFMLAARAKGLGTFAFLGRHGLRNALPPLFSVWSQSLIGMLSGAAVIETLFGIPGIGSLVAYSIGRRDMAVVQAAALFSGCLNVILCLAADLLTMAADPRLRHGLFRDTGDGISHTGIGMSDTVDSFEARL